MALGNKNVDWGMAELLAYASLIEEGNSLRLSGEDCERGTFSHRHSVYYNQKTQEKYYPLSDIKDAKGKYYVYNSLLSEFGVLGYEYGYSMTNPNDLTIWEAQFGDFSNGAVTIHDQYISAGEDKWLRMSGLVNLLPHGFEGQGPEHSSARLERFLAFCAQNNMIVANCTTPANLFHILRRQVKMPFRKPLIIMSPKSLLRHPLVVSTIKDFTQGGFQEIIPDEKPNAVKVVITSGKVYYDILAERDAQNANVAIIRVEQYYPFNTDLLNSILVNFKNAKEIVWLQEEPKNMGAWSFIRDYLQECTSIPVQYCGRVASPSPATGFASVHTKEQKAIITEALKVRG
jgi:2-oxoglutarate dehydrogenase E1 component